MADKILEVKNLKISFRTQTGTLKAVRDISFDLYRGRTLAIVGESGSGKSVTSKAILGILAGNSIVEGGEILYDGKDLLKLDEESMHVIRGDKISMIFQDPLSSLNPIVRIGSQITEAMLLKNKTGRRNSRKEFNELLKNLEKYMIAASPEDQEKIKQMTKTFDKFCIEANKLEANYNHADASAESLSENITDFLYMASKDQKQDVRALANEFKGTLNKIKDEFFTEGYETRLQQAKDQLSAGIKEYKYDKNQPGKVNDSLLTALESVKNLMDEMVAQEKPNFFRIGYYKLAHPDRQLHGVERSALNEEALHVLDDEFMNEFISYEKKGVIYSFNQALAGKKEALDVLNNGRQYFSGEIEKKQSQEEAKKMIEAVKSGIDVLETDKDAYAYTFDTSINSAIDKYFYYAVNNPKEEKRFAKESAKREALIAKGKTVDWKVVPMNLLDLDELKADILKTIDNLIQHFTNDINRSADVDFDNKSVAIIDYLKDRASKVVYVVTKEMAKRTAIKLMDEVGIPEPRMRYSQYPFEFSGGMRQRIVIAIALAANPEILICDEPTTALDVTIQAQILELINKLKKERNLSIIFITHDLGVVAQMADEIAVMYAGKICEQGLSDEVFYDPRHPYTWALLSSIPDLDTKEKLESIPGTPPNMIYPPVGDAFADRNKYAMEIDFEKQPPMFDVTETHKAATWLLHPDAPKVEMPKIIQERIARMKSRREQKEQEEASHA